jgi:hypothetical protein
MSSIPPTAPNVILHRAEFPGANQGAAVAVETITATLARQQGIHTNQLCGRPILTLGTSVVIVVSPDAQVVEMGDIVHRTIRLDKLAIRENRAVKH